MEASRAASRAPLRMMFDTWAIRPTSHSPTRSSAMTGAQIANSTAATPLRRHIIGAHTLRAHPLLCRCPFICFSHGGCNLFLCQSRSNFPPRQMDGAFFSGFACYSQFEDEGGLRAARFQRALLGVPTGAVAQACEWSPDALPLRSRRWARLRRGARAAADRRSAATRDCRTDRPAARNGCCSRRRHR